MICVASVHLCGHRLVLPLPCCLVDVKPSCLLGSALLCAPCSVRLHNVANSPDEDDEHDGDCVDRYAARFCLQAAAAAAVVVSTAEAAAAGRMVMGATPPV